jgi:hypothetical protein
MTTRTFPAAASTALRRHPSGSVVTLRARTPIEVADAYHRELDQPFRTISCGNCVMFDTSSCTDCVVTFLLALENGNAADAPSRRVELSNDEIDTLSLLQHSGLAPASNYAVRPLAFAVRR